MNGLSAKAHTPYVQSQEVSPFLDDGVKVKPSFHPMKKWLVSCPAHNAAVEILHSPETNEMCFKKIGDRTVNYRTIGVGGFVFKYHGTKTDFSYTAPVGSSNITVNGKPLSSYSPEEQAYYRQAGMASMQAGMEAFRR